MDKLATAAHHLAAMLELVGARRHPSPACSMCMMGVLDGHSVNRFHQPDCICPCHPAIRFLGELVNIGLSSHVRPAVRDEKLLA